MPSEPAGTTHCCETGSPWLSFSSSDRTGLFCRARPHPLDTEHCPRCLQPQQMYLSQLSALQPIFPCRPRCLLGILELENWARPNFVPTLQQQLQVTNLSRLSKERIKCLDCLFLMISFQHRLPADCPTPR